MYSARQDATDRSEGLAEKVRHHTAAVFAPVVLALLFANCSAIVNPPGAPLVSLDAHFAGCFCRDTDERNRDYICVVPDSEDATLAHGTGRGLLPGMESSDAWDFSGGNERSPSLTMARMLYFYVWGDDADGVEYEAILGEDGSTLVVRQREGIWGSGPLTRCGG